MAIPDFRFRWISVLDYFGSLLKASGRQSLANYGQLEEKGEWEAQGSGVHGRGSELETF